MIEVIESNSNIKLMALIICTFKYGDNLYCLYSIKRDDENDNIFISKLVKNSLGYTLDNNFLGGEKESLDKIITNFLNKDSLSLLKELGLEFTFIELTGINKFNKDMCYVSTNKRNLIKDCMLNYNLISDVNKTPIIKAKKENIITQDRLSTIFLIIFGIAIVVLCLIIIIAIYF